MIAKKKLAILVIATMIAPMILTACGATPEPEQVVVTQVVKETIKETVVVAGTPEVVEKEVTKIVQEEVEVEKVVTPTPQPTTRKGGWLDTVAMSVVGADSAVTQIDAGAIDIYASNLATPQDLEAIQAAGLERSDQFGLFYEITFNPIGPTFPTTGEFNPFSSVKMREAMNWLFDRNYLNQEIYGGVSIPKWFSVVSGFPDYARHVDIIRAFEAKYSYQPEKAIEVVTAEMEAMGAEMVDGKWTYEGEPVTLIILIRTDSDGTRVPIGDYVANQLEDIGFTLERQYKTASEASPIWILGNPEDGLWHLYTGAWGSGAVTRDDGVDFQFYYTPQSTYSFSPLWQAYENTDEFYACSEALANNTFSTLDERRELFAECLELTFTRSYRVWLIDGKAFSTWRPGVEVAYDLSAGVDINTLWPHTLRFTEIEGGTLNWGTPDLFVDPPNPIAGSNWTYDTQWQIATNDFDTIPNPHTGLSMAQRVERAEVTVAEGLPVAKTYDWVDLDFASQIDVPEDAWIDWDPVSETFITVGEKHPEGQTANLRVVLYYPEDLYDTVYWHDGSPMSAADFVMRMIMRFAPGTEGSDIYDESQVGNLESWKATFKGFKLVSESPLTFEWYSDTWYMDAEQNVTQYRTLMWPEYGYGNAPWHVMGVSNLAEAAGDLAYSADKSDANEIEWMSYIGGPSLEVLKGHLDQAQADTYIPYEATLGEFISAEEAQTRYANAQDWYEKHGHFWIGTGPYYLDKVFLVEKTATLKNNPNYADPSNKWAGFAKPKLAELEIDGPGRVSIGAESVFDVYITYEGDPYPQDEVNEIKYLLYDATGEIVEVGQAEAVEDGHYTVTLSADTTGALVAGANKLEVAALVIPVSIPSFSTFEFVAE